MDSTIEVYGTDTCKDTNTTRQHLEKLGAEFEYINIDADQAAAKRVEDWNAGERKTPTVVLNTADDCGRPVILSVPGNTELDVELDKARLLPRSDAGDGSASSE